MPSLDDGLPNGKAQLSDEKVACPRLCRELVGQKLQCCSASSTNGLSSFNRSLISCCILSRRSVTQSPFIVNSQSRSPAPYLHDDKPRLSDPLTRD